MAPKFRTGQIVACPVFLATIPRFAMIQAIIRHATTEVSNGDPVSTSHEHADRRFQIVTEADRSKTIIRLED